jgi:hypothetical protein
MSTRNGIESSTELALINCQLDVQEPTAGVMLAVQLLDRVSLKVAYSEMVLTLPKGCLVWLPLWALSSNVQGAFKAERTIGRDEREGELMRMSLNELNKLREEYLPF